MWKAVRNGDPGGYAYLAWMHHNGHIGGHLPPHLQPRLPDGGGEGDERAKGGGKLASRREGDLRAMAYALWGKERVEGTNVGRGVPATMTEGGGSTGGPAGGKGGSRSRGGKGGSGSGKELGVDDGDDDYDDDNDYYGYSDDGRGQRAAGGEGGRELMPGEDMWGGEASEESWEWETIGGGVSGAIAAADLYVDGFKVSLVVSVRWRFQVEIDGGALCLQIGGFKVRLAGSFCLYAYIDGSNVTFHGGGGMSVR